MSREKGEIVNRFQFEQAVAGWDGTKAALSNRLDIMTDRAESAEAELDRCRRALAFSRAMLAVERDRVAELKEANEASAKAMAAASKAARVYRRNWEKASAMLRLLTPEQVAELREAMASR